MNVDIKFSRIVICRNVALRCDACSCFEFNLGVSWENVEIILQG